MLTCTVWSTTGDKIERFSIMAFCLHALVNIRFVHSLVSFLLFGMQPHLGYCRSAAVAAAATILHAVVGKARDFHKVSGLCTTL
jgi:hypothetical protein